MKIPQSILDALPEFDEERFEYAVGPVDWDPVGVEVYNYENQWVPTEDTRLGRRVLRRRPKQQPRYELVPRKGMRITDEFCTVLTYGTDLEKWRKCADYFEIIGQCVVIRRRIEE